MNLKRNVIEKENKVVVKHIQHRVHKLGKKSSGVRVRGHEISEEKLLRWLKANPPEEQSFSIRTPSSKSIYRVVRVS
jgi:hypothetical protein